MSRQFVPQSLIVGQSYRLQNEQHHHLIHVLRKEINDTIILFNNHGGEYHARITNLSKSSTTVLIEDHKSIERSSPISIHLGQVISRKSAMAYTLEKACELGVTSITPLLGSNTPSYRNKLSSQWEKTLINACMQCGLNRVPKLNTPIPIAQWVTTIDSEVRLVLSPWHASQLTNHKQPNTVALLIGAEEGLNENDILLAQQNSFQPWNLGPRILRTETAANTSLSILQFLWGDLSQ